MHWAALSSSKYPELEWLHSVPNGGKRNLITAVKLKREGVKAGVPDLFLDVARGGFHGLRLELKAGKNSATREQKLWIAGYTARGYAAFVVRGWEEAREKIVGYLEGKL